jgi:hypothetical protein
MPRFIDNTSQAIDIFCEVWRNFEDRADNANRDRLCTAIADAVLNAVRTGSRDPADIYACAATQTRRSLN